MKNLINKTIIGLIFFYTLFFILNTSYVFADGTYGQYGGEAEAGQVMVDKMVRNPLTNEYVDNLGLNDAKFSAEGIVFFKITVQNTGGSTLNKINVTDYLPVYLQYVSGGNYDANSRQITFTFTNVSPGERRSTVLQAKVYSLSNLPAAKTILCPVNKVYASSPQDGSDEDTAQFCIEKKPIVKKEVPKSGDPLSLAIGLGSLTTFVVSGSVSSTLNVSTSVTLFPTIS